ncbi:hypothetical protein [Helicobacter zhangjianzhongii]|uniref:Uncharacterized protein n=1 Tax=Helicobacter zhangjianzhongii TaxID=2974574 RepID=A0ACC6FRK5_9HELI|nr:MULTISPECIES: hypothetical protein [unclassified Helicobacter]MDL0080120.1 hypothetical protein [Helicobacter sp. CPD2-1]MDL0081909.1 hypothetical protein [Helicobacter sp. XJK30-2]
MQALQTPILASKSFRLQGGYQTYFQPLFHRKSCRLLTFERFCQNPRIRGVLKRFCQKWILGFWIFGIARILVSHPTS